MASDFFTIINIMLYFPKIVDYLKILTDEEVKNFIATKFSKYFKSIREDKYIRRDAKLFYFYLATPDEVEKYVQLNPFDVIVYITIMLIF